MRTCQDISVFVIDSEQQFKPTFVEC